MVISKQRRSHIFLGFAQNQGLQASLCQLRGFAPYLMICSGGDQWDDDDEEEEEEGGGGGGVIENVVMMLGEDVLAPVQWILLT